MSEIDIITHMAFRGDTMWNLVQWWISISFGLMIASYIGSKHLSRGLAALSIFLYSLYSAASIQALYNQGDYIQGTYETLELLAATTELTPIGQVALENYRDSSIPLIQILCFFGFISTIGFVIYCCKKELTPNK